MTPIPNPPAPQGAPQIYGASLVIAPPLTPSAPKAEQVPQEVRKLALKSLNPFCIPLAREIDKAAALIVAHVERKVAEALNRPACTATDTVAVAQLLDEPPIPASFVKGMNEILQMERDRLRRELEFERKVKWDLAQQLAALQRENGELRDKYSKLAAGNMPVLEIEERSTNISGLSDHAIDNPCSDDFK